MSSTRAIVFLAVGLVMCAVLASIWIGSSPPETAQAAPAAPASSVTLFATQDAWIDEAQPGSNFGGDASLHVGRLLDVQGAGRDRYTLVQFDLSPLPAHATILSARLQLYQTGSLSATLYSISPTAVIQTPWDEATVTWNSRLLSASQGDPSATLDTATGWKSWSVRNTVQNWVDGQIANLGILLRNDGRTAGERIFGSRSNGQLAPRLVIEYARRQPPTPTRTPLPTWTPFPSPTPTKGPTATPVSPLPALSYIKASSLIPIALNPIDLSIYGIEITQGIQCFNTAQGLASCPDNSLPVVAKKDSTARIYLKVTGTGSSFNNVPVRLHIFANSVEYIVNTSGKAKSTLSQANADDGANVWFNVNFANSVVVEFYAEVDPANAIAETNETNNRYPSIGRISLTFQRRNTMKIVGARLRYHPSGYGGQQYAGGWAVNGGAADWFEQVLPIRNNGINYAVKSGYLDWTTSLGSGSGQHNLIAYLNTQWILENAFAWLFGGGAYTGARHVYGWAPSPGYSGGHADMPVYPHAGGLGVVGIGSDAPGTSTDNPGSGALIFGHEIVHDYNIYHTDTGADDCGSDDSNSDFPYSTSSIQEFGYNPITGKIYDPATTHDLMSYCPSGGSKQGWISPFTWNRMFGNIGASSLSALSASIAEVVTPTLGSESLVVNATIANPAVAGQISGTLGNLYRLDTGLVAPVPAGDYAVELRSGPTVLYSQTFTVSFKSEYSAHGTEDPPGDPNPTTVADVSFIVPWQLGTTSIALTHGGTTLDEQAVSPNAPQVTLTLPTQTVTWTTGTYSLTWTASDADGDPLGYSVLYSNQGGANWTLLAEGLTGTSFDMDANSLAGGSDTRFRVVATDGVNIGYAETPNPIVVPDKSPVAIITHPGPGQIVAPGDLLVLQGTATDLEDGGLPDWEMQWWSSRQGGLGLGPSLGLNSLLPGPHTITLMATDSHGQSGSASVSIYIGHGTYLPVILK